MKNKFMSFFLRKYINIIGILLLWILLIIIINPTGDFPLNDDWCYGKSVKTLLEENYLKLYNWGEMTLVAHVYWGYLFTKVFGFSFTVLRYSTLIMAGASLVGIYQLCKEVKISNRIALLSTLLCMVNPIFIGLSFSFMTDVPYYCLTIWSFLYFIKAMQTDNWKPLLLATIICCWAFLIRQIALVFPLAWFLAIILTKERTRKVIFKSLFPILVLTVLYFSYTYFMTSQGKLQGRYNDRLFLLFNTIKGFNIRTIAAIFSYLLIVLTYIGFLFAPLHLFYLLKIKTNKYVMIFYTFLGTLFLIWFGKTIPNLDNVWIDFGIGPTTLYDYYDNFKENPFFQAPVLLRWTITFIGVFSSIAIPLRFMKFFRKTPLKKVPAIIIFSLAFGIIYVAPFLIIGIYDRYLLALYPVVIVFLGYKLEFSVSNRIKIVSIVFSFCLGMFSVCGTHDYLSWNRVRWEVLTELQEKGVGVNHIQGGAEFTTWYHFSEKEEKWWENVIPVYKLVFNSKGKENIIAEYEYSRWLPGKNKIYLIYDPAKIKD